MINKKLFIGVLTTLTLMIGCTSMAFANENVVSKTQDNITVTKTAEWTKYNGQDKDANGNRYAKINFKIDTTNAATEITETISKGGDTDIVLIMDNSDSMSGTKIQRLKAAANQFVTEMLAIQDVKVRVGLVTFSTDAKKLADLSTDAAALQNAINGVRTESLTYIGKGISIANQMMAGSSAPNKFYIMLSDGIDFDENHAKTQLNAAIAAHSQLKTITIGYDTGAREEAFLKGLASTNCSGQPFFYTANINASNIVADLKGVFNQITEEVTKYVVGNSLTDIIPAEFAIVEGTIQTNDTNLVADISADKKTINWNWGQNKLEKKVYEMSVITVLDNTKVGTFTKINTNGTTIDPSADTSQSAIFSYGSTNKLCLNSPKLNLVTEEENVPEQQAPNAATPNEGSEEQADETPSTGDNFNVTIVFVLGLSFVGCVASVITRKRSRY